MYKTSKKSPLTTEMRNSLFPCVFEKELAYYLKLHSRISLEDLSDNQIKIELRFYCISELIETCFRLMNRNSMTMIFYNFILFLNKCQQKENYINSVKYYLIKNVVFFRYFLHLNLPYNNDFPIIGNECVISEKYRSKHFLLALVLSELENSFQAQNNFFLDYCHVIINLIHRFIEAMDYKSKSERLLEMFHPILNLIIDHSSKITKFEQQSKLVLYLFYLIISNLNEGYVLNWFKLLYSGKLNRIRLFSYNHFILHGDEQYGQIIDCLYVFELLMKEFQYNSLKSVHESIARLKLDDVMKLKDYQYFYINSNIANQTKNRSIEDIVTTTVSFANEIAFMIFTYLECFLSIFKVHFSADNNNGFFNKICQVNLTMLQCNQSLLVRKINFKYLVNFLKKHPSCFFANGAFSRDLCYHVLNISVTSIKQLSIECTRFLYIIFRSNYIFTSYQNLRIHMEIVEASSLLIAENTDTFFMINLVESFNEYFKTDKLLRLTDFMDEIKNFTGKINTIIRLSFRFKEFSLDNELYPDYLYLMSSVFSEMALLKRNWLNNLCEFHTKNESFTEAAFCCMNVIATYQQILFRKRLLNDCLFDFDLFSSNIIDHKVQLNNELTNDFKININDYTSIVYKCIDLFFKSERYEIIAQISKLFVKIFENDRNFNELANIYKIIQSAYEKIITKPIRLFGSYYRVKFIGKIFNNEADKEYIYKEPKVTSLAEIVERISNLYKMDNIKIIMTSNKLIRKDLSPDFGYIQINSVKPHYKPDEASKRVTIFEKNQNINLFKMETPFLLNSEKVIGRVEEQYKRITIFRTFKSFPYVQKRIAIESKTMYELTPIQVAIDEMTCQQHELEEIIRAKPYDMKKLQLKLSGSVNSQVNVGSMAYADVFLFNNANNSYDSKDVERLKDEFRKFLLVCQEALDINVTLIKSDQEAYHNELLSKFKIMQEKLSKIL